MLSWSVLIIWLLWSKSSYIKISYFKVNKSSSKFQDIFRKGRIRGCMLILIRNWQKCMSWLLWRVRSIFLRRLIILCRVLYSMCRSIRKELSSLGFIICISSNIQESSIRLNHFSMLSGGRSRKDTKTSLKQEGTAKEFLTSVSFWVRS